MAEGNYVLAMYDVRGKQEFIFRTNKLKEIVGGSWIIRDVFRDYLFEAARIEGSRGIYNYKDEALQGSADQSFSKENFEKRLSNDENIKESECGYIGEIVYDGGGNFLVMFKNEEIFREVTYRFTKKIMEEIGTLRVLATCVPIDNFDNYKADRDRLYKEHRKHEMQESIIAPWSCLPIVQVDRATSQPLIRREAADLPVKLRQELAGQGLVNAPQKYSKECLAKRKKFYEVMDAIQEEEKKDGSHEKAQRYYVKNINILDEMVQEKGEDSLLAVLFIDGNNMGAKVESFLDKDEGKTQAAGANKESYDVSVNRLRAFSAQIQQTYIENGVEAVFGEKGKSGSSSGKDGEDEEDKRKDRDEYHRLVVYAGDEMNFVVNAHEAYDSAKSYLEALKKSKEEGSACAGIAVFHSHAPYAEAYRIAEECCESAKKRMKEEGLADANLIDFHICQGAIGTSLEQIREDENGEGLSRPWIFSDGEDGTDITKISDVERLAEMFRKLGRTNVKDLADRAMKGVTELSMELMRIRAHLSDSMKKEMEDDWNWLGIGEGKLVSEKMRWMIYDVVLAFDLWFDKGFWKGETQE